MKLLLIAVTSVAIAFGAWQRSTLIDLRQTEARLSAEPVELESGPATPAPQEDNDAQHSRTLPVTDAEMVGFTTAVLAVKDEFETNWFGKFRDEDGLSHPILCETLRRLTSEQLRSILDAWRGDEPYSGNRATGIHCFMLLASKVNPSAAVPLMYELLNEFGERNVPGVPQMAFQQWFRQDPDGLLKWAEQAGMPDGFGGLCALWADAVLAAREPSVENIRKFVSHTDRSYVYGASSHNEVILKLPTQEARLTFFQNLHAATGGVCDDIDTYVRPLAPRVPFTQLAHLADESPAFKPSKPEGGTFGRIGANEPLGSLRFEVAMNSRDSTAAQRWEWLVRRDEDRPAGRLLGRLAKTWCRNDYPDTAAWVRTLSPGPERDTATNAVIVFLKQNGAAKLIPEWEAR